MTEGVSVVFASSKNVGVSLIAVNSDDGLGDSLGGLEIVGAPVSVEFPAGDGAKDGASDVDGLSDAPGGSDGNAETELSSPVGKKEGKTDGISVSPPIEGTTDGIRDGMSEGKESLVADGACDASVVGGAESPISDGTFEGGSETSKSLADKDGADEPPSIVGD